MLTDLISNPVLLGNTLIWLIITLLAYKSGLWIFAHNGRRPLLHPLLITSLIVGSILYFTDVEVQQYQQFSFPLHWLLGPATIALAVPLFRQLQLIKQLGWIGLLPIVLGGVLAPLSAFVVLFYADIEHHVLLSMLTKSITTPLAMETSLSIGGTASLAAVFVIFTGIIGAMLAGVVFNTGKISSERAQGIALGTAAHAVGTAHAFQISEKSGAFSTLALCINGVLTAIILPLLIMLLN